MHCTGIWLLLPTPWQNLEPDQMSWWTLWDELRLARVVCCRVVELLIPPFARNSLPPLLTNPFKLYSQTLQPNEVLDVQESASINDQQQRQQPLKRKNITITSAAQLAS